MDENNIALVILYCALSKKSRECYKFLPDLLHSTGLRCIDEVQVITSRVIVA